MVIYQILPKFKSKIMRNLQVTIDPHSGFCFGVIYAITMAEEILENVNHLYCLGDIVHNDEEIARLKVKGLKIIDHHQLLSIKNEKVLIRAHGEPSSTYKIALENNIELIDASCPVVLKLQNRIKNSYDKNDNIYIYGKHGHAEVTGLLAQTSDKAVVFENMEELDLNSIPKNITLYSQTTKSTEKFYAVKKMLGDAGITVETNDTICRQVSNRDLELKRFAKKFDKIMFVSGIKSSNGKVLFQACKEVNTFSYAITKPADIDPNWFQNNETIGICGATSTPLWLMQEVKDHLLNI